MSLTFVHLSDIHFQVKRAIYDLDRDLRNELELDCIEMRKSLPAPASVLISGDIAFKGTQDEYDVAWAWLSERLCQILETPTEKIRCIPGNHDVYRDCVSHSKTIRDCYRNLRTVETAKIYSEFQEYEREPRVFYEKLEAYNRFALRFGCDIGDAKPYWESDFKLEESIYLRVRGLNSTLVSDSDDDDRANKLILGQHQFAVPRQEGFIHMVLSHHPPQWLRDEDQASEMLDDRCRIQLYGHKHSQKIRSIDQRTVRICAGAVHPDRREPEWQPRYNWIQVEITAAAPRALTVRVYPRVWARNHFDADFADCAKGQIYREEKFSLDEHELRPATVKPVNSIGDNEGMVGAPEDDTLAPDGPITDAASNDPTWTIAHRYLTLSYTRRIGIAEGLKLIEDSDEGLPHNKLFKLIFRRARERGLLEELWELVEQEGTWKKEINPFKVMRTDKDRE